METGYFQRRSLSAERPLPSPTDTPYETPRVSSPRLSSHGTITPITPMTNSTTSVPNVSKRRSHHGDAQYDPEQFTPTLHASLVSEILNLRRELDTKRDFIEDLEGHLASSRAEADSLQSSLRRQGKESRALKRELQLHEDGTLSAMEALAKERDDFREANSELRRRLDTTNKRLRSQEEDALRFKSTLEQERSSGANSKRTLERRAEVAEQQLRAVVEEVAASQAASLENSRVEEENARPTEDVKNVDAMLGSPESTRSARHKHHLSKESLGHTKPSLADELDFSDSNYDQSDSELVEEPERPQTPPNRNSITALRQDTPTSRSPQTKERILAHAEERRSKVLGMVSAFEQQMKREDSTSKRNSVVSRTFSQTSSKLRSSIRSSSDLFKEGPRLQDLPLDDGSSTTAIDDDVQREHIEFPRSQRSRAKSDPILGLQQLPVDLRESLFKPSLASLARKIEDIESQQPPPQPSAEFTSSTTQTDFPEPEPPTLPTMASVGVQTIAESSPPPPRDARPPTPTNVPEIAVHPPSNPPSPPMTRRRPPVPLQTRSVGVQTPKGTPIGMVSTSMQTDVIRVDRRLAKLPPHLLPSALDEQEKAREQAKLENRSRSEPTLKGKEPAHFLDNSLGLGLPPLLPPLEEGDDDLVAANDGPLEVPRFRRSYVTQSTPVSPTIPEHGYGMEDLADDIYSSDTEFATRTPISRPAYGSGKHTRRFQPPAPLPEDEKVAFNSSSRVRDRTSVASRSTARSSTERQRFSRLTNSSSDPATEYQSRLGLMNRRGSQRSRSPSLGSVGSSNFSSGPRPPFIIPMRGSSREQYAKIRVQRHQKPSTSPRRNGRSSPERPGSKTSKASRRKSPSKLLRKARSSAAIPDAGPSERPALAMPSLTSRSVPQAASTTNIPYTSDVHKREIGIPHADKSRLSTLIPTGGASVGSAMQHDVVDAITATTIGEWMFKYMRKRNTFGVMESGAESGKTSEARHKRWVWLSPYERTVMWSNKQPRTNAALMGKAGRKLPIQSVLDVKDDTPPPKEAKAAGLFNRSILILTPDRALKFTAPTKDRHYLWLTALSFLAHQSVHNLQNIPRFAFQPPNSPTVDGSSVTVSSGRSRASSFRNPLRSTRSKVSSHPSSGVATPLVEQPTNVIARRELAKPSLPDSAFAPTVPRVPHSRKRSMSMTGAPSTRGRTNVTSNSALRGYPAASLASPALTSSGSTRFPSVSAASSRRHDDDTTAPSVDFGPGPELSAHRTKELSPRASRVSTMSAEFGGNNNFFDAVGVVRMDAFSKTRGARSPSRRTGYRQRDAPPETKEEFAKEHVRQDSDGSFIGPPDIGRYRVGG